MQKYPDEIFTINGLVNGQNSFIGILNEIKKLRNRNIECNIEKEAINNILYYKFKYKKENYQIIKEITLWIDCLTNLPVKYLTTIYNQKDTFFIERQFINVVYNENLNENDFLLNEYENFKFKEYELSDKFRKVLSVGSLAPDIELKITNNDTLRLSSFLGKTIVLEFWATNCGASIYSIDYLKYIRNEFDVEIVTIVANKKQSNVENAINKYGIDYNVFKLKKQTKKNYKVFAYPTFYVIDKYGIIKYSGIGILSFTGEKIISVLNEID